MKKIIILSLFFSFILTGCSLIKSKNVQEILGFDEAKAKAEEFINNNLMQPGSKATVKEITEEDGLYKLVINIGTGQDINSYLTKDGKTFFPQSMNIKEIEDSANNTNQNEANNSVTVSMLKLDKPKIEMFVMSYCPYGTQIEKGILPVLKTLGDKIDFELKFCDYAMHDKKELDEQLLQYCIQKEEPEKLVSYLTCFLADGDSKSCLEKASINNSKLNSCVSSTDKQYKITENYGNKSTWKGSFPTFNIYKADNEKYGISGSPGLVINGIKMGETVCSSNSDCHIGEVCVNSGSGQICSMQRNPESIKQAICDGFNNVPEACSTKLSSDSPSPGFGFGTSNNSTNASCN